MNEIMFSYNALDSETRIVVRQRTSEIKTLMKRTAQDIIEIGEKLIEVKGRLPHGAFGGWLESEFGWNRVTAHKFMRVAETFSNVQNSEHLNLSFETMAYLAAPSTPEPARQEAIARAEAGETITHKAAKEIVTEHKAQPEASEQDDAPEFVHHPDAIIKIYNPDFTDEDYRNLFTNEEFLEASRKAIEAIDDNIGFLSPQPPTSQRPTAPGQPTEDLSTFRHAAPKSMKIDELREVRKALQANPTLTVIDFGILLRSIFTLEQRNVIIKKLQH